MVKDFCGKWITTNDFIDLEPIDIFKKEHEDKVIPPHRESLYNQHIYYRKKVTLPEYSQVIMKITADDCYHLYINGKLVTIGPAPSYYWHYYYNEIDVTPYLKQGENSIAVHVNYMGVINRVCNSGDYRCGMIADLIVDEKVYCSTDATWKYKKGTAFTSKETMGYDTQFKEDFDFRQYDDAWGELTYNDDSWDNAVVNEKVDYIFTKQPTPNIQLIKRQPAQRKVNAKGNVFIDLEQEVTGYFHITVKGKQGQKMSLMYGEECIEGTTDQVRYQMRCNCHYLETITLKEGVQSFRNFDYKAFRYIEIACDEGVEIIDYYVQERHYPFEDKACLLKSNVPLLDKIFEICKNGVKYGTQESFLDCPSREKGQYLGDLTVSSQAYFYLNGGDTKLIKKTLEQFALSTQICEGMMAVVPGSFMQEIADFSLQWPLQLYNYYWQSGDKAFIEKMYPVAEGIIKYFRQYQREDGLLDGVSGKWNLVDWPHNLRDDYDFDMTKPIGKGCHNVINAFYIGAVSTLEKIKDILGITYTNESDNLKQAYIEAFFNQETQLFMDAETSKHPSLHSNVLPLFFDIAPKSAYATIVELIREKRLKCGVYMAYFVLKALARAKAYDLIYELIVSEDEHSWGNMIKEGATTCFEAWGKDQKANTSLCHPWASAPVIVIIEDLLGIKPTEPGFKQIQVHPHIQKSAHINLKMKIDKKTFFVG